MPWLPSRRAVLTALPALLVTGCQRRTERRVAPEFELKDPGGSVVRLSQYRGKVVLLNFWATWCGPCVVEIPWFVEFERRYKDQGFAVLGISMDEDGWEAVRPFMSRLKVNYRVLMGDDRVARDYGGVDSLPTTFMIDREGKVARVHVGLTSKRRYENDVVELLDSAGGGAAAGRPAGGAE
ncbi:MAG: TlpA family protein disulfide reductase [Acidobacteria bacterium]|nr:TlpA family protein disulfide reductase [Acidobacteriota bacterium]